MYKSIHISSAGHVYRIMVKPGNLKKSIVSHKVPVFGGGYHELKWPLKLHRLALERIKQSPLRQILRGAKKY